MAQKMPSIGSYLQELAVEATMVTSSARWLPMARSPTGPGVNAKNGLSVEKDGEWMSTRRFGWPTFWTKKQNMTELETIILENK